MLPCIALGNPKPEVTWLKDEELIQVAPTAAPPAGGREQVLASTVSVDWQVNERVTVLDSGALKIHNIHKEDAGQYRCVARNSLGLVFSKLVTIQVQGRSAALCVCVCACVSLLPLVATHVLQLRLGSCGFPGSGGWSTAAWCPWSATPQEVRFRPSPGWKTGTP